MEQKRKRIPYTLPWNDMPIDISHVFKNEKPAGKHGFLAIKGDKFIFEDGTEGRFWGVNFNSGANFPSYEYSEKVARRLAKTGVNIVRFHQLDAEWSTSNLFQFEKGENKNNTRDLDPKSMDRLDYLIYCLKKEGVYIYLDLLCYRRFKSDDGIGAADCLGEAAKPFSNFDSRLIELQKKFNYDLWTHINPYTNLAFKDDPVFVLAEITNENDLFSQRKNLNLEPYRSDLEKIYRKWAEENDLLVEAEYVDFLDENNNDITRFFCRVLEDYYLEIIEHLREIGVKIPITGTNWSRNAALLSAQLVTDFTDTHNYWWKGDQREFSNLSMTDQVCNIINPLAFFKVPDKPLFISEWDQPWPNEWRAESTLLLAAVGAFQGWGGFAIHTYRYGTNTEYNVTGKLGRDLVLGNSYYRGIFDSYNDPAKYGLFYHAALITRRADVKQAQKSIGIKVNDLNTPGHRSVISKKSALTLTPEMYKVGMIVNDSRYEIDSVIPYEECIVDITSGEVMSDTGELYRSWNKKYGWVDTPKTKAAYGFLGGIEEIELDGIKMKVKNDFATIALSSITSEDIRLSTNMLLTAVGRAESTNCIYNDNHTAIIDSGVPPILIDVIEAYIEIKTEQSKLKVWAVNPEGFFTGSIPSEYSNGVLRFHIGKEFASMYYLIQKQ
jgi:hypothetical protein